jgi:hypothetical protein
MTSVVQRSALAADEGEDDDAVAAPPFVGRAFRRQHLVYLSLITLLAAFLRLYRLEQWSIWVDEAHTWRDVSSPIGSFFDSERSWYPLSFLMLRWLADVGALPQFSEGWLRLPFACCGIVSVPLLAVLGNALVGRRAALLAALFLAVNPWHIYFSQNARGYVMVFFCATIAAGLFWLGLQRGSRGLRVAGVAAAAVGGACHLTGLSLLPMFVVYPLLGHLRGRGAWRWVIVLGAAGLLVPLLFWLLPPLHMFQRAKSDVSLTHLLVTAAFFFRLPLLCAAATGFWLSFRTHSRGRVLFLACWLAVPLFGVGVIGSTMVKVTARYAFCALPAVMLLAGAASVRLAETLVAGLGRGTLRSRLVPAAVLPAILCLDMMVYDYGYFTTQYGDRARWRAASSWISEHAAGQSFVVYSVNEPSMLYYLRPLHYAEAQPTRPDADPYPGCRIAAMTSWEIARGWSQMVGYEDGPPVAPGEKPQPPPGCAPGAEGWLHSIQANATRMHRALFFVATLPELAEMDPGGRLLAAFQRECELQRVLPCWVGPKDETIYVFTWPRR